ncbi:N-acetylglucosaminyl deacetylase, LmbE family [Lachnospiraceae bacterium XBD2001]|nr:N-acetylglucosaminyl deacetylase, LmbE family [Lachnospiraceae bacterium XBD2001]
MRYLFVVAHPDDEVLGAGATIYKLVEEGHQVAIAIMSGHAAARANISATLSEDEKKAMDIMGVQQVYHADFPNIKMNTVPHLELVQFIEKCIEDWQAEAIITHHPSDTNIDHQETGRAVNAACRLFQRTEGVPKLCLVAYMEVPSSTEWSLNSAENSFKPNTFVEVGKSGVEIKLRALEAYQGVMRPYPHPRSEEAIEGLAAYRGAQYGAEYAETFEVVYRRGL